MPFISAYNTLNTIIKHNIVPNNCHLKIAQSIAKIKTINPTILYPLFLIPTKNNTINCNIKNTNPNTSKGDNITNAPNKTINAKGTRNKYAIKLAKNNKTLDIYYAFYM